MTLSWKPEHLGKKYCAPACGAGCTRAAYEQAKKGGKKLAKRLGKEWKPRIWENMGWHYAAISPCGRVKVHPNIYCGNIESYMAFIGDPESCGGTWAEHGETPEEAIQETLKIARECVTEKLALIDGL